jgi:site-specific recombinase XerD
MLAQGCRLEEVSEIIRHASIRVTKDVYGHLSGERLREATDKMGEFLGDL